MEVDFAVMFDAGLENAVSYEIDNGKNNGDLGDDDTGSAKSIDNEPAITKPGDFCGNEAGSQSKQAKFVFVALD